ncbi:folylpolyglutamate synthase [Lobulomyces angularis]|nr:folylpolyglutamate synthase [Lobulomyces angularis]
MDLSLHRIKSLLSELGNPQDQLKVIHVAGTNGKGSVTTILSHILKVKHKVGKYNSPYLLYPNDSIKINELAVEKLVFENKRNFVKSFDKFNCTLFEINTAVAFLIFAEEKVDYAIVEVGLGGANDATNVFTNPLCCVFTSISFDHEALLGNTLKDIAIVKSGIIKPNSKVFSTANQDPEVLKVLKSACEVSKSDIKFSSNDLKFFNLNSNEILTKFKENSEFKIQFYLLGEIQLENLSLSLTVLETLNLCQEDEIIEGLKNLKNWKGRIEKFIYRNKSTDKDIAFILDGCHNPASAICLSNFVNGLRKADNKKILWVFSLTKGKDAEQILTKLLSESKEDEIFFCGFSQPQEMPWIDCVPPKDLLNLAESKFKKNLRSFNYGNSVLEALKFIDAKDDIADFNVIFCGSLYFISDFHRQFLTV